MKRNHFFILSGALFILGLIVLFISIRNIAVLGTGLMGIAAVLCFGLMFAALYLFTEALREEKATYYEWKTRPIHKARIASAIVREKIAKLLILDTSIIISCEEKIFELIKNYDTVIVGPKVIDQIKEPGLRKAVQQKSIVCNPNLKYNDLAKKYLEQTSKHKFYLSVIQDKARDVEFEKTDKYQRTREHAMKILSDNKEEPTDQNLKNLVEGTFKVDAADIEVVALALQKCEELKGWEITVGEKDSHIEEAVMQIKKVHPEYKLEYINPYEK